MSQAEDRELDFENRHQVATRDGVSITDTEDSQDICLCRCPRHYP